MIWDERNSDWAATYGFNSHFESLKSELHHVNSGRVKLKRKAAEFLKNNKRRKVDNRELRVEEFRVSHTLKDVNVSSFFV